ncbi:MAG: transcription repressor NadR [Eubacterium sp.]|nr:transcription repressor NadR [Eubacterium sp.]
MAEDREQARPLEGEARRNAIAALLKNSDAPISGAALGQKFSVSRQVIVQDIALLRTRYPQIISTHRGYILSKPAAVRWIFKVNHGRGDIAQELNMIVDTGARVVDVFVRHPIYGEIKAPLNIASRRDVELFSQRLATEDIRPLTEITDGIHYHTVEAESADRLELVRERLAGAGILLGAETLGE